ncbi:hypothetical protein HQ545_08900 [Candidatus Woesearchaeota archaeon]|nr:hypothetical protein [Candidatus Woesearchaeota archaeon]
MAAATIIHLEDIICEKLASKIGNFKDSQEDLPCNYGEALLVLNYMFNQYHDAYSTKNNDFAAPDNFVGVDEMVKLNKESMSDENHLHDEGISKKKVNRVCSELYSDIRNIIEEENLNINQKYHIIKDVLFSFKSSFAELNRHSQKNPYRSMLSLIPKFTGH